MDEIDTEGPIETGSMRDGDEQDAAALTAIPLSASPLESSLPDADTASTLDERRRVLLGDPSVQDKIRRIASREGVLPDHVEDIVDEILRAAIVDAHLPLGDRREGIRYLSTVARSRSIAHARGRATAQVRPLDGHESSRGSATTANSDGARPPHEIVPHGRGSGPRAFASFVARLVHDAVDSGLTMQQKVSPDRLRAATSGVVSKLRVFAVGSREIVLVVVFCLVGGSLLWIVRGRDRDAVSTSPSVRAASIESSVSAAPPSLPQRALAKRAEARQAFDGRQWKACIDLLDEAQSLDPDGETPEIRQLFEQAAQQYVRAEKR